MLPGGTLRASGAGPEDVVSELFRLGKVPAVPARETPKTAIAGIF